MVALIYNQSHDFYSEMRGVSRGKLGAWGPEAWHPGMTVGDPVSYEVEGKDQVILEVVL